MGQYAGFGTAAETNGALPGAARRGRHRLLRRARPADADGARLGRSPRGRRGRQGRRRDRQPGRHRDPDGGDPARAISQVRTTANSIGYIWAAMFVALAEQRSLDPNAFGMFIQNDVLKEYIASGTQIFPAEPSLRLSVDVLEYVAQHVPELGAARDLRLPHPRIRLRRRPGDRVHVRERDRLPGCRRCPGRLDRRRRTDALHLPVVEHRAPPARWRSSGRRGACGRSSSASGMPPATRGASSCASSSSPPARR